MWIITDTCVGQPGSLSAALCFVSSIQMQLSYQPWFRLREDTLKHSLIRASRVTPLKKSTLSSSNFLFCFLPIHNESACPPRPPQLVTFMHWRWVDVLLRIAVIICIDHRHQHRHANGCYVTSASTSLPLNFSQSTTSTNEPFHVKCWLFVQESVLHILLQYNAATDLSLLPLCTTARTHNNANPIKQLKEAIWQKEKCWSAVLSSP